MASSSVVRIEDISEVTWSCHPIQGDIGKRSDANPSSRCNNQVARTGAVELPISESGLRIEDIGEDGVTCSILSRLTLRDAVRTAVLSRRWRNAWKYIPDLIFDAHNMLEVDPVADKSFALLNRSKKKLILEPRADRFIQYVDGFLSRHMTTMVSSLAVNFYLCKKHAHHLDRWLNFLIDSGAQRLCLVLYEPALRLSWIEDELYDFPCQLFDGRRGSSLICLHIGFCKFRLPAGFAGFSSLKILSFGSVDITGADIKSILSICSNVERLNILYCHKVVGLEVYHPSGRMKYLVVRKCHLLKEIEFSGISLNMFAYEGRRTFFTFKNAARVKALCLMRCERYYLTYLPCDFQRLEKLIWYANGPIKMATIPSSYRFTHLKHLSMFSAISSEDDFVALAFILKSVPLVETFQLHLRVGRKEYSPATTTWPEKCIFEHLKQLKIAGFGGAQGEINFVLDMVRSAIVLESVILDPYLRLYIEPHGWMERSLSPSAQPPEVSREIAARHLGGKIGHVELVIL